MLEDVLINISTETSKQKEKLANKLHRQFGHPSAAKLKELLKNAGLYDDILMKTIDNVSTQCDVCQRFTRTSSRPLVSMPMAQEFNEAVAMELKIWDFKGGIYILCLIDVALRYTKASITHPKSLDTIIENAVTMWIAERPGAPRKFLSDNGGEFAKVSYVSSFRTLRGRF